MEASALREEQHSAVASVGCVRSSGDHATDRLLDHMLGVSGSVVYVAPMSTTDPETEPARAEETEPVERNTQRSEPDPIKRSSQEQPAPTPLEPPSRNQAASTHRTTTCTVPHKGTGGVRLGMKLPCFGSVEYSVTERLVDQADQARRDKTSYVVKLEEADRGDMFKYALLINLAALEPGRALR